MPIYLNFYFTTICQAPTVFSSSSIISSLSEFIFVDAAACQSNISGGATRCSNWLTSSYPDQVSNRYSSFPMLVSAIGDVLDITHPVVAAGYSLPTPITSISALSAAGITIATLSETFKTQFKRKYFERNETYPAESVDFNEFVLAVANFIYTCFPT